MVLFLFSVSVVSPSALYLLHTFCGALFLSGIPMSESLDVQWLEPTSWKQKDAW